MRKPPRNRRRISDPDVLERMRITFELYEMAVVTERQNLRRRNPSATEEEIAQGIREWHAKGGWGPWDERMFTVRKGKGADEISPCLPPSEPVD